MALLFKNEKEQRICITGVLTKIFPEFKTGGFYYREYLKNNIGKEKIVLDAGCGAGGMISEFKPAAKLIIGVDADPASLEKNSVADRKITANLEQIPLENNSVDVATAEFVLEHLERPGPVFKELARVLKPGGVFIFITSNVFNPVMALSKILPRKTHKIARERLLKKEEETHRTFYRANSYRKLMKLANESGFAAKEIQRAGNPGYLGFCRPLVWPAVVLELMIDNQLLDFLKMYLIGCFVKSSK